MTHESQRDPQLTIWDELGGEPRSMIEPSAWDYHCARQIDPDADTELERGDALVYSRTRPPEEAPAPRATGAGSPRLARSGLVAPSGARSGTRARRERRRPTSRLSAHTSCAGRRGNDRSQNPCACRVSRRKDLLTRRSGVRLLLCMNNTTTGRRGWTLSSG